MPEPVWNDDDMVRSVAEAVVNVKGIASQQRGGGAGNGKI
jgi:hypothetical protein